MTAPDPTPRWRYALASVMGTSHVRSGDPCQDACACEIIATAEGDPVLVAVASDGAGSARLSQLGSSETCSFVVQRIRSLLADGVSVGAISREVTTRLILEAQDHLRATARAAATSARELACTLVGGVVGPEAAAFFQVGDGVVIVGPRAEPANEFSWVFWPERGEYANTTVFLSDERVAEHLQHDTVPYGVDELAILTDGIQGLVLNYREHAAHAPFFSRVMAPLRACAQAGHSRPLSAALAAYLASTPINDRTDDDKTLVLASRRAPV